MKPYLSAACMACLLVPALLGAEQTRKPVPHPSRVSDCQGTRRHGASAGSSKRRCPASSLLGTESVPGNGVVIYNGTQKQTRIFNAGTGATPPVKNLPPDVIGIATDRSGQSKGPVVVGITTQPIAAAQPVVVHVASSGSSAQPVVVDVASSGFQTSGTVAPVAIGVSPRPAKRRPYRPAALDAQ